MKVQSWNKREKKNRRMDYKNIIRQQYKSYIHGA